MQSLDPRATYLRTSEDPGAQAALILSLAALGFLPGEFVSEQLVLSP